MPGETKLVAVATDGSAGAALAVEWAANFARSLSAELLAIQVVAGPPEPESAALEASAGSGKRRGGRTPEASESEHASLRAVLESSLPAEGISAGTMVESGGGIAAAILDAASRAMPTWSCRQLGDAWPQAVCSATSPTASPISPTAQWSSSTPRPASRTPRRRRSPAR